VDGNNQPALGHYTSISEQRMHEQRNILPGHLQNYESGSGNPTHRREIQATESTTSVDVCLKVVYFSPTAYSTKYTRKKKQVQGNYTV
jgi:hypothetical protein